MRTAAEEMQEDKIGQIGRETVNGFPLGGTERVDLIALSPSSAEERSTKNRPAHHIGCGIKQWKRILNWIIKRRIVAADRGSDSRWRPPWIRTKVGS